MELFDQNEIFDENQAEHISTNNSYLLSSTMVEADDFCLFCSHELFCIPNYLKSNVQTSVWQLKIGPYCFSLLLLKVVLNVIKSWGILMWTLCTPVKVLFFTGLNAKKKHLTIILIFLHRWQCWLLPSCPIKSQRWFVQMWLLGLLLMKL